MLVGFAATALTGAFLVRVVAFAFADDFFFFAIALL